MKGIIVKMGGKGFRYSFTFKEMWYILFNDKRCPKCKNLMYKKKYFEECKSKESFGSDNIFYTEVDMKEYYYCFYCESCKSEFKLSDLAEKKY